MRVLFAGGGTGGHIYPALAVADELASRGRLEALFVGTRRGLEATVVPAAGYRMRTIVSRGVRGRGPFSAAATIAVLIAGTVQAATIIARFRPDVVFGSGGYASAAAVAAGFVFGRTIVLQEQNSVPGMANRMLAPLARRIYVGFEQARERLGGGDRVVWTGNPLRRSIGPRRDPSARRRFGLREDAPVLLVFGGSQGAMRLNRAAARLLRARPGLQGIVQTGERGYEETQRELAGIGPRVFVAAYIDDIEEAYASADIALARAGALSVSELAAVGLPAVLVPYPHAADNHQFHNARVLVEAGGAEMIDDDGLDETSLAAVLDPLLGEPSRLEGMRSRLASGGRTDAASAVADDLERLAGVVRGPGSEVLS